MSTVDAEVQKRRDAEWAAAKTREELEAIEARWWREDEAAARAEHGMAADVARLARRVERVERLASPDGTLSKAMAEVIGMLRKEIISPLAKRVAELEQRVTMVYRGVHDDAAEYNRGDCVTCAGSVWIALAKTKGRPSKDPDWRLVMKAVSQAKEPGA